MARPLGTGSGQAVSGVKKIILAFPVTDQTPAYITLDYSRLVFPQSPWPSALTVQRFLLLKGAEGRLAHSKVLPQMAIQPLIGFEYGGSLISDMSTYCSRDFPTQQTNSPGDVMSTHDTTHSEADP